jgi:hypothetical protein
MLRQPPGRMVLHNVRQPVQTRAVLEASAFRQFTSGNKHIQSRNEILALADRIEVICEGEKQECLWRRQDRRESELPGPTEWNRLERLGG